MTGRLDILEVVSLYAAAIKNPFCRVYRRRWHGKNFPLRVTSGVPPI